MEQQDFIIQDIKNFILEEMQIKWYGEIFDCNKLQYRDATIEDFNEFKRNKLYVVEIKNEEQKNFYDSTKALSLPVIIVEDTFIALGRNYSKKWQEFKAYKKTETLSV